MIRVNRLVLAAAIAVAAASAGVPVQVGALDTPAAGQTAPAARPTVKDGTWRGTRVNTFYGYLQVEVLTSGGAITEVRVPEFPDHDGTSRRINKVAIPHLVKSAVASGSAEVDTISGATITSKAFAKSLETALAGAAQ